MKTVHDIVDVLYAIINVASVTDLLDGEVYRFKKPLNNQLRDITIRPLVNNQNVDTQSIVVNVNIFAKDLESGIADEANLKPMTEAVVVVLEAYNSGAVFFKVKINSQLLLDDNEDPLMSYSNLRLNCVMET